MLLCSEAVHYKYTDFLPVYFQEMSCILHGVLYFLAVPSMSMLLIFYSVGNMHNVNWGTRENKTQKVEESSQKRFLGQTSFIGNYCMCFFISISF